MALPALTLLGAQCLELLQTGRDDALAARLSNEFDDFGRAEVVAHLRARAGEPVAVPPEPDSMVEARRRGFVPLGEHTGITAELGPLWPAEHRLSRLDLGDWRGAPDDTWLVHSPWQSLSVGEVLTVLWRWVERDPCPADDDEWTNRVLEVFGWKETEVQHLL